MDKYFIQIIKKTYSFSRNTNTSTTNNESFNQWSIEGGNARLGEKKDYT